MLKCEVCGGCCRGFGGGVGGILNYWIHVQTLWLAECPCLCIPAQSFYVPVVPSGIIYNSRQFYNSPFSAIYIDHRGCQSQARNTDFSRGALSFPLFAAGPTAYFLYIFHIFPLNKCEISLKMKLKYLFPGLGSQLCQPAC